MSAKLATLGLLKTKAFQNEGYDAIIFIHDVLNKFLSFYHFIFDEYSGLKFNVLGLRLGIALKF